MFWIKWKTNVVMRACLDKQNKNQTKETSTPPTSQIWHADHMFVIASACPRLLLHLHPSLLCCDCDSFIRWDLAAAFPTSDGNNHSWLKCNIYSTFSFVFDLHLFFFPSGSLLHCLTSYWVIEQVCQSFSAGNKCLPGLEMSFYVRSNKLAMH